MSEQTLVLPDEGLTLLREIRDQLDLLVIANHAAIAPELHARYAGLAKLVNSEDYWRALEMTEGTRTVGQIAKAIGVRANNLRRWYRRVENAGYLDLDEQDRPKCVIGPGALELLRQKEEEARRVG